MPSGFDEKRSVYAEAYSLVRLERSLSGFLDSFNYGEPGAVRGALRVVSDRLSDLRYLDWDAVVLAERSFRFGRMPCMVTRRWNAYTIFDYPHHKGDKDPYIYNSKGGQIYVLPDSLLPFRVSGACQGR